MGYEHAADRPTAKSVAPTKRERLLEAGVRCIRKLGIRKITMEDVAAEAGVSRITLYREFGNRETYMVELVAFRLAGFHRSFVAECGEPGDAASGIATYLRASVREVRRNPMTRLVIEGPMDFVEAGSPLFKVMEQLWRPVLERAKAAGQLRSDLAIEDAVQWIVIVQAALGRVAIDAEVSDEQLDRLVRTFVSPAFANISPRRGET